MGGYVHKHWAEKRHRWSKFTNIQDGNTLSRDKFDAAFPDRRLSNWEVAELREFCSEKGIEMPEAESRTLPTFITLVGRPPADA
jgi:hypothetical protein